MISFGEEDWPCTVVVIRNEMRLKPIPFPPSPSHQCGGVALAVQQSSLALHPLRAACTTVYWRSTGV